MLLELRKVGATLHDLQPDNVYVSSQGTRLVATSLFAVTFNGMRVLNMTRRSMPYSNADLVEHQITSSHNQERTLWSVGVIILELFVGQDLIKCLRTNSDVLEVVDCISSQLGARLYTMVRALLFEIRYSVAQEMLVDGLLDNPDRVRKALKEVGQKVQSCRFLQDMLTGGEENAESPSGQEISEFGQASTHDRS
jgi:hypothetical protein